MKSKIITKKLIDKPVRQRGLNSPYYLTGEDGPMRPSQKKVLSDYINLISDPLDREGWNRELESGLSCGDAEDMLRVLMGQQYWK